MQHVVLQRCTSGIEIAQHPCIMHGGLGQPGLSTGFRGATPTVRKASATHLGTGFGSAKQPIMTEACTERRVAVLAGHFRTCSFGHSDGIDAQVGSGHIGTASPPAYAWIAFVRNACISTDNLAGSLCSALPDPVPLSLASPRRAVRIAGLRCNPASQLREGGKRVGLCAACASLPCACLRRLHSLYCLRGHSASPLFRLPHAPLVPCHFLPTHRCNQAEKATQEALMWADRTLSAVQARQRSAAAVIEHHPSKVLV
jgi:hypothetical protein